MTKQVDIEDGTLQTEQTVDSSGFCTSNEVVVVIQKVIAEVVGTYFLLFIGSGSVAVNKKYGSVTFPGICFCWGLVITALIYSVGHISGAHFNPAVTVTFAIFGRFPYKQVPLYVASQVLGSILGSGTLCLLFDAKEEHFFGTAPVGSNIQSFFLEIIISFLLMFVISGVATDSRAMGKLAGIAIGGTVTMNVFMAGPVSGASMNPARTIGPAVTMHIYKGIWVYMVAPFVGTILGAFVYNLIRYTQKPLREIGKTETLVKSFTRR